MPNGCWIWQGKRNGDYARYGRTLVHRYLYEEMVGPIPTRTLDHFKCDTPLCVNPFHVRPATDRENTLRGDTLAARNLAKMHCPEGHPYDEENTYVDPKGARHCRTCQRQANRASYHRRHGKRGT